MATDGEILKQFGEKLVEEIKNSIPKVSGATRDSVRFEVVDDIVMTIYGAHHIGALEFGRKPTKSKDGDGSLLKAIKEWIKTKGLKISAWVVADNIHKYGTTLYRMAHGPSSRGEISLIRHTAKSIGLKEILNEEKIKEIMEVFKSHKLKAVRSEILKDLK